MSASSHVPPHSVEHHLRVAYADYDRAIRTLVPHYDEMLATGLELLAALAPSDARVLDVGGGTGALSEAVLRGLPGVSVTLLDIDPQMLAQARARLAPFGPRVTLQEGSFHDPLPPSDAVVASLALHHIGDLDTKMRLYAVIRDSLAVGGLFLNLDATVSADPAITAHTFARWAAFMGEHGIDEATARRHFAEWAVEDRYFSLHQELGALARAGFAEPECFWRRGSQTIYGGLRR
jgi:SAM-dependent methyltransferase